MTQLIQYPTSVEGVPAYQMMIVVYGGTTADIAQAIYDLIGVNIQTYGTTAYTITTEDSDTQVIYHTKASEKQLSVRVTLKRSFCRLIMMNREMLLHISFSNYFLERSIV